MADQLAFSVLHYNGWFNSSHFVYGPNLKEEMHGHNYTVSFEVHSTFSSLPPGFISKAAEICREMNNRVIIAKNAEYLVTDLTDTQVSVFLPNNTHFSFPRSVCYVINEVSSTAECIARHFFDATNSELNNTWKTILVRVAETHNQQEAIYQVNNPNTVYLNT